MKTERETTPISNDWKTNEGKNLNEILDPGDSLKQNNMEKLFHDLIEAAKQDKKGFQALKTAIVKLRQYELALNIRQIELEAFPETEEVSEAKKQARETNLLFRMVDVNADPGTCWIIAEAIKIHNEKKGEFSLEDSCKLLAKKEEIFDND